MKNNIIWLASYPKSGNTWFRIFLSNIFSQSSNPVNINQLDKTPIASSRVLFDKFSGIDSSDLSIIEINKLRPKVYGQISEECSDNVFLKVHDSWALNTNKSPIFPPEITRSVVYIIRNPLDIAVSFAHHNNKSIESTIKNMNDEGYSLCMKPQKLHNQLNQHLSSWSNHVRSWVLKSGLPIHVIRFEDMIEKPLKTFSEAITFLEIECTPELVKRAIENSSFKILRKQEEDHGFNEKSVKSEFFFRKGNIGNWKHILSRNQIEAIISKNKVVMDRYGYLSDL